MRAQLVEEVSHDPDRLDPLVLDAFGDSLHPLWDRRGRPWLDKKGPSSCCPTSRSRTPPTSARSSTWRRESLGIAPGAPGAVRPRQGEGPVAYLASLADRPLGKLVLMTALVADTGG